MASDDSNLGARTLQTHAAAGIGARILLRRPEK